MRRSLVVITAVLLLGSLPPGIQAQVTAPPQPPAVCIAPVPGPPVPAPLVPFATPPAIAAAPADSAGQSSANAYPFPITRHRVSGLWLDYVKSHGDVDNLGLPRSEVICDPLTGQIVQYFQRVVLEYHPEQTLAYRIQR